MDTDKLGRDLQDTIKKVLREYAETLALAILLALILRFFVVSAYRISNPSMIPTLRVGDFILAYKLPYGFTLPFSQMKIGRPHPQLNDLVVFRCPHDLARSCIKRVVALPGDRVEIRKKKLIVNGQVAQYEPQDLRLGDLVGGPDAYAILSETDRGLKRSIFVGDRDLDESFGPYIVPPEHFFALSDNRDEREDSRSWGGVPTRLIEARAVLTWFSVDWSPTVNDSSLAPRIRTERIFRTLH